MKAAAVRSGLLLLLLALGPACLQAQETPPTLEWVRTFSAGLADVAFDVAVDASGKIIAVGATVNPNGLLDARVIKFSAAGDTIWNRQLDTAFFESAVSVDTDFAGNIYMVGPAAAAGMPSADRPCRVWKLDPEGNELWHRDFLFGPFTSCVGVAVDNSTHVYVAGNVQAGSLPDALIFKLDAEGQLRWHQIIDVGISEGITGLALDSKGNVVVGGTSKFSDTALAFIAAKVDPNGLLQFTRLYRPGDGPSDSADMGSGSLAVDPQDNILMGGTGTLLPSPSGTGDIYIKATPTGSEVIRRFFPVSPLVFRCFGDASSDDEGAFYCPGTFGNALSISKLDASGQPQWFARLFQSGFPSPGGVDLDKNKNVYLGGTGRIPRSVMLVAKYKQTGAALTLKIALNPAEVRPQGTGGNSATQVQVTLTDPQGNPVADKDVTFAAEPAANSGGHDHGGIRPVGTFSSPPHGHTGPDGKLTATYTASEFGGQETIKVHVTDTPNVSTSAVLEVMVPGLELLPASANYLKIGGTDFHFGPPSHAVDRNHYGAPDVIAILPSIAVDYTASFPSRSSIKYNDISLPFGGLFDVNGNWRLPHSSHRAGRDVDVRSHPPHTDGVPFGTRGERRTFRRIVQNAAPQATANTHSGGTPNEHIHLDF